MVGFGMLVICAGVALHHDAADLLVLGAGLLVCAVAGLYLLAGFRSAPSGFPWPDGERSGSALAPPPERSSSSTL